MGYCASTARFFVYILATPAAVHASHRTRESSYPQPPTNDNRWSTFPWGSSRSDNAYTTPTRYQWPSVVSPPTRQYTVTNTLPAPYNLVAIASDASVCVQWERPAAYTLGSRGFSMEPITSYSIQAQPEGSLASSTSRLQRTFAIPVDASTESKVTGLSNGYTYIFTVVAEVSRTLCCILSLNICQHPADGLDSML